MGGEERGDLWRIFTGDSFPVLCSFFFLLLADLEDFCVDVEDPS